MSSDRSGAVLVRHLRMAWRAESIILEAGLSRAARQLGLLAFAALIAAFGLAALDGAAFFALAPIWGSALAMVAVGLGDFVIAVVLLAVAARQTPSQQAVLAQDLRNQAFAAVELDVELATNTLRQFARNPFDFVSGSIISFLVSLFTSVLKSQGKARAP